MPGAQIFARHNKFSIVSYTSTQGVNNHHPSSIFIQVVRVLVYFDNELSSLFIQAVTQFSIFRPVGIVKNRERLQMASIDKVKN